MNAERRPIPGWVATLVALGLGTVLVVGLAEAGFRVAEVFLDRSDFDGDAERVILAEGDSFTYGIGGLSYPQQLEEVLADRLGERRYAAINRGIPGLNTAALADMLEQDLLTYDPAVVVVLIGENDSWNTIRTPEVGGAWHAVDRVLLHSRVYKFVRVAVIGWRFNTFHEADAAAQASRAAGEVVAQERPPHHVADDAERLGLFGTLTGEIHPETVPTPVVGPEGEAALRAIIPLSEAGRYEEVVTQTRTYLETWPEEPLAYETLAAGLARLDRLEEAAEVLRRGLADTEPSAMHENLWFVLGSVLQRSGRTEEAMAAWREALTRFPRSKALFWSMSNTLYQRGTPFEALEVVRDVPGIEDNELYRYLLDVRTEHPDAGGDVSAQVVEAMRADLRRIVALTEAHGARLVLASYPDMAYPVVAEVAAESGTPYVDFRPHFQARFESREQYISPDRCHCNTEGYRLMAEVLADVVLQGGGAPGQGEP